MEKFLAIALIIAYVIMLYYIVIGRRKKMEKKMNEMLSRIDTGTRVKTISGIYGTVVEMDDKNVVLEICCDPEKSIKVKALKGTIREIV